MLLRSIDTQIPTLSSQGLQDPSTREIEAGHDAPQPDAPTHAEQAPLSGGTSADTGIMVDRRHIASRVRAGTSVAAEKISQFVASPQHAASAPVHTGSAASAAVRWDNYSLYNLASAAERQGLLSPSQKIMNGQVSGAVLGNCAAVATFATDGIAALANAVGVKGSVLSAAQLAAATNFVNAAPDGAQQRNRLSQVLDTIQALSFPVAPQRTAQEMKDELKAMFNLPDKAFKKMSDAEIRSKYNEVMAKLSGPAETHTIKFAKKYNVTFSADGNGNLADSNVKKKGLLAGIGNFFKKFGTTLLTICSFIPIPWIAIPARIISGVIAIVKAVKEKSVLGAVVGVASVVAGGAAAVAGKALAGVAGTVSKVAETAGKAARGIQAAANAVKSGNVMGVVSAAASVVGAVAGGIGDGFESIAKTADKVVEWSNRVLVGKEVLVSIKDGHFVQAIAQAGGLVAEAAGEFKGGEKIANIAQQVQTYAGYAGGADQAIKSIRNGDIAGALNAAATVANGVDHALGSQRAEGEDSGVAQYLKYAGSALSLGTSVVHGDLSTAFNQAGALVGNVVTQQFGVDASQANSGWANTVDRWLNHAGDVVQVVKDLRNGSLQSLFDHAPGVLNDLAWDFGQVAGIAPADESLTRETWKVKQDIAVWTGRGSQAWQIAGQVKQGDYAQAIENAFDLAGQLGLDPAWAQSTQRILTVASDAYDIGLEISRGRFDNALDLAAAAATRIGGYRTAAGDGDSAKVAESFAVWLGRGADAVRIEQSVRARGYEAASLQALELAVEIAGGRGQAWGQELLDEGAAVIESGFGLGQAIIDKESIEELLRNAGIFAQSVGGILHKRAA